MRWRLFPSSVKESVDNLPVGLCCYWPGGLIKLKNNRMDALSLALYGETLLDGEGFWTALTEGRGSAEFLQTGLVPVIRLPDGAVFRFFCVPLEFEGAALYEVLAVDMTEEYNRNAELSEKRKRTQEMNDRMRALNREIDRMVVEKEVLAAKVRIHDDVSRALLSSRRYLAHPSRARRTELLGLWDRTIHILQNEGPDVWRDSWEYAVQTAREFGITLTVKGTIPEEQQARQLLSTALIACLSNAFRHAGANKVTVELSETQTGYAAVFTNNGEEPSGPIEEKGGLVNLRKQIENAGGRMLVRSIPRFELTIAIPKEEDNHAL